MPNYFYSGRFLEEPNFYQNWLYVAVFSRFFNIIVNNLYTQEILTLDISLLIEIEISILQLM